MQRLIAGRPRCASVPCHGSIRALDTKQNGRWRLAASAAAGIGAVPIATLERDVHDIGKNLCNIMCKGAGFSAVDLGVNVSPDRFAEEVKRHAADVVAFSAFFTTTMPMCKANINAREKAGLPGRAIVPVGAGACAIRSAPEPMESAGA